MIRAQAQGRCFSFLAFVIILIVSVRTSLAQEEIIAEVGKNVTLHCTSAGIPVWWSFDGQNVTNKDERISFIENTTSESEKKITENSGNLNVLRKEHILNIANVKLDDEGNYTCHQAAPEPDQSFYMQPVLPPNIVRHNDVKNRVKISQSIVLYCLIEAYPAEKFKTAIKWHKEDNSLTDLNSRTQIDILNTTHINATLEIPDVFKKDNGTYVCTVASTLFEPVSAELSLLVLDVPKVSVDFVKAVGASKIFVNWTVNDGNDPIETYFIQYLSENASGFTYYRDSISGKNTSTVLHNFEPNTKYKIKLAAKNANGLGPPHAYPNWIRTLEKDPLFIPNIEVTGSTSSTITIGWQPPPKELLDYIQYYKIVISEAENNSQRKEAIHLQNSRNLPYMFDDLKTATAYSFRVRACCELTGVCGPWSEIVNGSTTDGAASEPQELKITCSHYNISRRNEVAVSWTPPANPNGQIINYHVVLEGMSTFRTEKGEYKNETYGPEVKNPFETRSVFDRVFPNMNYTVKVSGTTRQKKMGEQAQASCTMPVTVPDNIGRITWGKIKTEDDRWVFKLYLPRLSERNGPICCYRIYLVRISENNRDLPPPEDLDIQTYHEVHSPNNSRGGAYLAEMFPSDDFRSEVFLGDGKRMTSTEGSMLNADETCRKCFKGIPFRRTVKKIIKPITSTTTTENPKDIEPIVPEKTQREQLTKAGNLTQAATNILEKRKRRSQEAPSSVNKLEETTTPSSILASNLDTEVFDGLIDVSSNYTGFIELAVKNNNDGGDKVLFAYSGYFEMISPSATAENYEDSDNMSLILNIVVQVFCALILLVLVLLSALWLVHRYYSKHSVQGEEVISLRDSLSRALCGGRTSNHRHLIGSALTKPTDIGPISKVDLPQAYINRHKDTDYGFLREYEMLPNRFNDRTTKNSDAKENSHKNRYPDIKAYDQTRVKISMINSILGSDYINANFVIGYKERKKFICAQGPMDSTIIDFWRMIWEQHLEIIVMLTNLEEYNKAKCAKYWPEKILDTKQFGDITVVFASEQRFSDYLVRNLDIFRKNGNGEDEEEERHITQYHYLVWKDFMAPEHPHGIIKFIRQINNVYSVQRGPILVHCSAGVGRTGTLVALDSLIQQLEEDGQVSIFNTVCDLRHQRNFLVQSLKQYIFLYRALLDIAQFGNTELHARGLSATVEALKQKPNDSKEKCRLELQFEKIKAIVDETNKSCSVGGGKENLCKNRSEVVIPFDRNRVILTPIPSREHSTYINASFIEGYDNSESFIITQDPLENTIGDFWRMICEQGITTLVMISEIGDGIRKCPRYWADDEIQYDHILVKYMHSESCPYYTRREFNVTNCKIDDTIKVTQFQYNGWPTVEGEVPEVCRGIIELVDQAQRHHNSENNFSTPSPIAVHCSIGTDRSSIFVAMCILVQQLRTEKKVDICTTTRKLRSQRSLLLDTYAQYEFLHRAIVNYADLHKLSLESPSDC